MKTFTRISLLSAALMAACLSSGWAGGDPPPAPTNVSAVPGNGRVTLNWDPALNADDGYLVYWSANPGVTTASPSRQVTGIPHAVPGLTNGTRYYFRVASRNQNTSPQTSGLSAEVSAVPQAGIVPAPPTGVRATAGTSSVTVFWDISPTAESYNVYYRPSTPGVTKANGTKVASVWTGPQGFYYSQPHLTQGICHYFVVTGVNGVNESAESFEVCATPYKP